MYPTHVPSGKMYVFSQFQGDNSHFKEQNKLSTFCDILTALCHSQLYFCIPNFEIGLSVNLFYLTILYYASLFPILFKLKPYIPDSVGQVIFPNPGICHSEISRQV